MKMIGPWSNSLQAVYSGTEGFMVAAILVALFECVMIDSLPASNRQTDHCP